MHFSVHGHLLTFFSFFQQAETTEKRRAERAEAFVAPAEITAPTVEEKRRHRKRTAEVGSEEPEEVEKTKKKKKRREKKGAQEEDES